MNVLFIKKLFPLCVILALCIDTHINLFPLYANVANT